MKTILFNPGNENAGMLSTSSFTALVLRISIMLVMFPHGCQSMLGAFGGGGFSNTMQYFTEVAGLPWLIGFLVIFIQFFGSVFILLGFLSRLNAFAMLVITVGMIFSGHVEHGFFMNWYGTQAGEGYEFHLLLFGLCLALLVSGGGKLSVDRLVHGKIIAKP